MLTFKSLLKACSLYIEQCDLDQKDFFNKSKLERMLDEARDAFYLKPNHKQVFMKYTECDGDSLEKTFLTMEQFVRLYRHVIESDKYHNKEVEGLFKFLSNQKPLNFKRFVKLFKHRPLTHSEWGEVGLKQLRDWIIKKRLSSVGAFERLLQAA